MLLAHRSKCEWKDGYRDSQKYKNRLEHYNEYCLIRNMIELYQKKGNKDDDDVELITLLNSSLQRKNRSFVHLIADDKWAFFAYNEKLHFEILYFMIKHISELIDEKMV